MRCFRLSGWVLGFAQRWLSWFVRVRRTPVVQRSVAERLRSRVFVQSLEVRDLPNEPFGLALVGALGFPLAALVGESSGVQDDRSSGQAQGVCLVQDWGAALFTEEERGRPAPKAPAAATSDDVDSRPVQDPTARPSAADSAEQTPPLDGSDSLWASPFLPCEWWPDLLPADLMTPSGPSPERADQPQSDAGGGGAADGGGGSAAHGPGSESAAPPADSSGPIATGADLGQPRPSAEATLTTLAAANAAGLPAVPARTYSSVEQLTVGGQSSAAHGRGHGSTGQTTSGTGGGHSGGSGGNGNSDPHLTPVDPIISATEGNGFDGIVGTFLGSEGTGLKASVSWGDGGTSEGAIDASGGNSFNVVGRHTWAEPGSHDVVVTVSDAGGSVLATDTSTATVADATLTAHGVRVQAAAGFPFTGEVATLEDGNPGATTGDFTAITVSWGDGLQSPGNLSGSDGNFTVAGAHTYAQAGSYSVIVSTTDVDGNLGTAIGTATVSDASLLAQGLTAHAGVGATFTGPVATLSDLNLAATADQFLVTIDWGDGDSSSGTVSGSQGSFTISGSHAYSQADTYTSTVTATDSAGAGATAEGTVVVAADSRSSRIIVTSTDTVTWTAGVPFAGALASFIAPGGNPDPRDYYAQIETSSGDLTASIVGGQGSFAVIGRGTFFPQGGYPLTIIITDNEGDTAQATAGALVLGAPLSGSGQSVTVEEGQVPGVLATFTDPNNWSLAWGYTAYIDWGNGRVTSGEILADEDALL